MVSMPCPLPPRWALGGLLLLLGGAQVEGQAILMPRSGASLMTDRLLVMVNATAMGMPNYWGQHSLAMCLQLKPDAPPFCWEDYNLGNQDEGVFAAVLGLDGPGWYRLRAFAVEMVPGGGQGRPLVEPSMVDFEVVDSAACTPPVKPRQVWDAVSLFNELDLLEVRMRELWPVVDKFIVVESNMTHSGRPKPYVYADAHDGPRFSSFDRRVVHVAADSNYIVANAGPGTWDREVLQRDLLVQALVRYSAQPHDLVIIADVDEVPRRDVVRRLRDCHEASLPALIMTDWYIYNSYWRSRVPWGLQAREGLVVVEAWMLLPPAAVGTDSATSAPITTPTKLRRFLRHAPASDSSWSIIEGGGWHFSSFGDADALRLKLRSYADDTFASAFLQEPGRAERLQYFGVPYYFLTALSSPADADLHFTRSDEGQGRPHGSLPTPIDCRLLRAAAQPPAEATEALNECMREDELHGPLSQSVTDLFFPPRPEDRQDERDPAVTDPRWLWQDVLRARLEAEVGGDKGWAVGGDREAGGRPRKTLEYNCSDTEVAVLSACPWGEDPACRGKLREELGRLCEGRREGGSLNVILDDAVLVPVEWGGSKYVLEAKEGDDAGLLAGRACRDLEGGRGGEADGSCRAALQSSLERMFGGEEGTWLGEARA